MTTYFPLFPLQLVVFPGERLNLHIFEDRYKQLVNQCFNTNKTFGIPAFVNDKVSEYGTEVEILSIEKLYPDGKMDIRTRGLKVFRILEFFPKAEEALYPAGVISFNHEYSTVLLDSKADEETVKNLKELLAHLADLLDISKNLIPSDEQYISFRIAHYLGMSIEDEYSLLLTHTETQRQQMIIRFLEKVMPNIEHREAIRKKIALNGHFKELKPPHF
jgi:hypothetical protein